MGKHFGNLQWLKGVTYYSLSPQELDPFKGMIYPGVFNNLRKLLFPNIFTMGIPLGCTYLAYLYVSKEYEAFRLKNPDDYKDDV